MANQLIPDQKSIIEKIQTNLKKTDKIIKKKKTTNTRLLVTGMTTSAASTLVAGVTSAGGPVIGSGIEGWRLACITAAVLSFVATISTGISQQLKDNDSLSEASICLSRLRSLDLSITTGTSTWEEIMQEYQKIASLYPEFIS
jgi:hypothetical protein